MTALAIGNLATRADAASCSRLPPGEGRGEGDRNHAQARSHDTSRISWAKLIARIADDFPLACPGCGGDIRFIAFITELGPSERSSRNSASHSRLLSYFPHAARPPTGESLPSPVCWWTGDHGHILL